MDAPPPSGALIQRFHFSPSCSLSEQPGLFPRSSGDILAPPGPALPVEDRAPPDPPGASPTNPAAPRAHWAPPSRRSCGPARGAPFASKPALALPEEAVAAPEPAAILLGEGVSARSPCGASRALRLDPGPPPQSVGLGTRGLSASVRFLRAAASSVLSTPPLLRTCLDPRLARPRPARDGAGGRGREGEGALGFKRPPRPRLQGKPRQVHARGPGPDPLFPRTWGLRQSLPRLGQSPVASASLPGGPPPAQLFSPAPSCPGPVPPPSALRAPLPRPLTPPPPGRGLLTLGSRAPAARRARRALSAGAARFTLRETRRLRGGGRAGRGTPSSPPPRLII